MKPDKHRGSFTKGRVRMKIESFKIKMLNFLTKREKACKADHPLDLKEAFSKFARGGSQMNKDQRRRGFG
ncbi:hypothetical protein VIGAN_11133800 [Vigna angularis var. angularis]|uniref:Uncharacterized protein n=1 Tax=Vigna angularis var. angularis TaxID=157739 RepID=A0A0S3T9Q2_PHAAN|nr:hypothetical protein VIGAN_11133800 [Vigna angularis var. angularis]